MRATAHSSNLPEHDRTVINAYRAFIGGEFAEARDLYQQLLGRDSQRRGRVVRARRGVVPRHRRAQPGAGLHPGDPRLPAHARPRPRLRAGLRPRAAHARNRGRGEARATRWWRRDSFALAAEAGRPARWWTARAPGRGAPGPGGGALHRPQLGRHPAEHAAGARRDGGRLHRVGELRRGAGRGGPLPQHDAGAPRAAVRRGPHPVRLGRRGPRRGAAPHRAGHRRAAGLPAVPGHADRRATTSRRRPTSSPTRATSPTRPRRSTWPTRSGGRWCKHPAGRLAAVDGRELAQGGARASSMRGSACPRRRFGRCGRAPPRPAGWRRPDARKHLVHSGASAAIGLFTGPSADSTAIVEYRAHDRRVALGREVRALLALSQGDSTGARRMLTERDTMPAEMPKWTYGPLQPAAGGAGLLPPRRLSTGRCSMLRDFEPQALKTGGFDSRWGMLGRVRLLRAAAYEQLGRRAEARQEYQRGPGPVEDRRRGAEAVHPAGGAGAGAAGGGVGGGRKRRPSGHVIPSGARDLAGLVRSSPARSLAALGMTTGSALDLLV